MKTEVYEEVLEELAQVGIRFDSEVSYRSMDGRFIGFRAFRGTQLTKLQEEILVKRVRKYGLEAFGKEKKNATDPYRYYFVDDMNVNGLMVGCSDMAHHLQRTYHYLQGGDPQLREVLTLLNNSIKIVGEAETAAHVNLNLIQGGQYLETYIKDLQVELNEIEERESGKYPKVEKFSKQEKEDFEFYHKKLKEIFSELLLA